MEQEKKEGSYESFREAVEEYSEDKGHDLLTDPDAVAAAKEKVAEENAATHGDRLRQAREAQGFTVPELAAKTGIDAKELALWEAGEALLPLGQLIKLSKVLSLKMSDMISAGEKPFTIVRAGERQSISRFGKAKQASHGYEYVSLAPGKKGRLMEPFIVTLQPAAGGEPSFHDGQEFIYVLEGEMEVIVGDTTDVLKPGDAVYYDSTSMHLVRAHGNNPVKILAVLVS
jgi:quercetin dioxygenase-like cupin family protein/ribosome-binding protein aMBF1 (putative translation factor)